MFIIRLSPKNLSWIVSIFIPSMSLTKECVQFLLFPRIVLDSNLINRKGWHKKINNWDNKILIKHIKVQHNHYLSSQIISLGTEEIWYLLHPEFYSSFTSGIFPRHFYSLDTLARKWHCPTFISIPVIYSVGSKHPLTPHSNSSLTWPSAKRSSNAFIIKTSLNINN